MWFAFDILIYLLVPEEEHHAQLYHVLEYEVFVIVAELQYVCHYQIVQPQLPLSELFIELCEIVALLLSDIRIKNLLIYFVSEGRRHPPFGVLD